MENALKNLTKNKWCFNQKKNNYNGKNPQMKRCGYIWLLDIRNKEKSVLIGLQNVEKLNCKVPKRV